MVKQEEQLTKFFAAYGAYHNNLINKLIHIVFIPIIVTTFQGLLLKTSYPQISMIVTMILNILSGILSSFLYGCSFLFVQSQNFETQTLAYLNAAAWIAQFIGHGIFEKRAPALMDNILLTLNAPHFVTLEILFFLGYKKNVEKSAQILIDEDIRKYHQKSKSK